MADPKSAPAALLFDMDGLLLDTERLAMAAFLDVTASHGVAADQAEAFFLTLVGTSNTVTRARVTAFLPDVDISAFDRAWAEAMHRHVSAALRLMPTVADVLEHLSGQGHRMAVVTSTDGARARHHLEAAGLANYFERVTGGDEVSANKPDPAPYLETAAALGVDASACFAFEDSDRGLTAAVRAGCRAVQIPDLRPPDVPLPDLGQHVAANLRDAMVQVGLMQAAPAFG